MTVVSQVLRMVFLLAIYFAICMIIAAIVLRDWSDDARVAFVIGVPVVLVWWGERRRARKDTHPFSPIRDHDKDVPKTNATVQPTADQSLAWVPASETATVAGRDLGGMVYVGTPPRQHTYGYRDTCRAYIDPSLKVARTATDKAGDGMPYWPGYSSISPQCRATYLDWLASGRSDPGYNPGYMFLYFYGLERRFFVDQSKEESKDIVAEVRRLLSVYPHNHSVQRYLGEFVDIAMLAEMELDDLQPVYERQGWELPLSVKYAIGARLDKDERLSADWLLSWFMCHPESRLRTPASRCREEFLALFKMRFDTRYPDGLKVNKPRQSLAIRYRAASSEFEGTINPTLNGGPVPDISKLRKPVEIAQEIADDAMDDLDKFSRYLGRNSDGRGSLEAYALLPHELWDRFPSDDLNQLKAWAMEVVKQGGLAPVVEVIGRLEGTRPEKISKRQLTGMSDALARLGFGVAPDPRFALRSPKIGEPVVVFDLGEAVPHLEDVSSEYRSALVEAALGSFVAHADDQVTESERKALIAKADSTEGLSAQERRRLVANIEWMLAVPPDLSLLRRKLKDTGPDDHVSIREALVAAAHADGVVQSEEVAGIEKLYKALGLDPALVYSDLHAGEAKDGPVRVREAEAATPGEAIPPEQATAGLRLSAARIAEIQTDTHRVSSVLGEIFNDLPDERPEETQTSALAGLDVKHTRLVKDLIVKERWSDQEFQALCSHSELMASGALEHINEWAFEVYEEALLEEYEGYEVSAHIAQELKKKFGEETGDVQA